MNARALLLFTMTLAMPSFGQTDSTIFSVAAEFSRGSIWTGRESLQQFTKDHPWSAQIDLAVVKNSQRAWDYCRCYSRNGVSLGYINFSNPAKLGSAVTVAAFAEPILLSKPRFKFALRGSAGVAFVNRLYDSISNRDNIFFSTNTSFFLSLGARATWRFSEHFALNSGVSLNHISNGGRKDPNEGMNFPGFTVGINYNLRHTELRKRTYARPPDRSLFIAAHLFGNQRTAWADKNWGDEKRVVTGLDAGVIKRLGRLSALGAGAEYYYDGINAVFQQRSGQPLRTSVAGVGIQHYLFFGKLLFGQQVAWYITSNTGYQRRLYQRYFLEYEVKQNWYAGFSLKAHADHSDYLAFTTGYFFKITPPR